MRFFLLSHGWAAKCAAIMTNELTLISNRRRELAEENKRLAAVIAANGVELTELDMAEKVIVCLTGASRDRPVTTDAKPAAHAVVKHTRPIQKSKPAKRTYGKRPLADVIMEIVKESAALGVARMEPKEALELARVRWKPNAEPQAISTTFWRLMKQGALEKDDGTSFYRLPKKELADDTRPAGETSSAIPPAQGREGVPGGGG